MKARPVVIVLAAGGSSRFEGGGHKLAQELAGSSVLGTTLRNVIASRLPLVVVTTERLAEMACRHVAFKDVVLLPEVESQQGEPLGMGYSIVAGVAARAHAPGWLVLPGDMPLVRPETISAVADALSDHPIAYAQHRGRRGHPVGFDAELYSELIVLRGDVGASRLLARYPAAAVEVGDPGVLVDVDTVDDLQRMRAASAATAASPGATVKSF